MLNLNDYEILTVKGDWFDDKSNLHMIMNISFRKILLHFK